MFSCIYQNTFPQIKQLLMGCISSKPLIKQSSKPEKYSLATDNAAISSHLTKGSLIKGIDNITRLNYSLEQDKSKISQKYKNLRVSTKFDKQKQFDRHFHNQSSAQRSTPLNEIYQQAKHLEDKVSNYPNNKYSYSQRTDQLQIEISNFRKTERKVLSYKQSIREMQKCHNLTMNSRQALPISQPDELVLNQSWPRSCFNKFLLLKKGEQQIWDSQIFKFNLSSKQATPKTSV